MLILCIALCQLAGVVGSYLTDLSVSTWYPGLVKPSYTPPGWFIGLVWIILYTLMGVSLFLVLEADVSRGSLYRALIPLESSFF